MGLRAGEDELRALLVERLELLAPAEFDAARAFAKRLKIPIEHALVMRGRVPLRFLLEQLAHAWGVGYTDLKIADIKLNALHKIREEYARGHVLIPFDLTERELLVAMADPCDARAISEVQRVTNLVVRPFLAPEGAIHRAHLLYRGDLREMLRQVADTVVPAPQPGRAGLDDAPAASLLSRILEYAAMTGASDIHVEPYEHEALVRYRIDGVLQEVLTLVPSALPALVSRIKVLAGMRIDERRQPQDGHFDAEIEALKIDLRVSSLPTHWGEKVVMRVLSQESHVVDLETLGLTPEAYALVSRNLTRPYGMILVTGPTGSGKTTSLYAMVSRLGQERQHLVNISTIEDPVEQPLARVTQVSINPPAGIDFASGLRALLRQDPDIIMVGEIRDRETAEIAVRAALVGRLLLSTLHTNDAPAAIPRLIDMGVEPFLLASTLTMVIGQRLVRKVCVGCRESIPVNAGALDALQRRPDFRATLQALHQLQVLGDVDEGLSGVRVFRGRGCPLCGGTGFRGRVGVFEVFEIDNETRRLIVERRDAAAIRAAAIARGMRTMFQDSLVKVFLGDTTIDELLRATV